MLGMLIVFGGLISHQLESMIVKNYGTKHGKGGMLFNAILCLAATVYFIITDKGGFIFPNGVLIYGIINSTMYAAGFYAAYLAFNSGSFGLTRLFTSFGSILTILYGTVFLKEPFSPIMVIAVVLIFFSVFLMKYQKNTSEEKSKFSIKWIISVLLIVVSNALISIIGKMQHNVYSDTYKNEYLIVSFVGSAFWLILMGFIFERCSFKTTLKHGLLYGVSAGLFNGINNLFIIIAYNYFPISFLSPVRTGLGMGISFLVSSLIYKEKFNPRQITGVIIGVVAVVLMNIK